MIIKHRIEVISSEQREFILKAEAKIAEQRCNFCDHLTASIIDGFWHVIHKYT
jgi:hypothetical protein